MDTSSSRKIASSGACLAAAAIVALSAARAQTPPPPDMKNRPPLPPGMEYYPKPILSHGRWVLWHGKGRVAAGEGRQDKAAAKSPARAAAPPKAAATATTILVSVGASTDARIVEDMRAALGPSGAAISAKVGAATSKELADGLGGADLAIARSDGIAVMEGASKDAPPLAYVAPLFPETVTIVARDGVASLAALDGRAVAFGAAGSADVQTSALLFKALGIAPKPSFLGGAAALAALAKGDVDAAVIVGARSSSPLAGFGADGGFHLVDLAYDPALRPYFMPARIEPSLYPKLAPQGAAVGALATMAVLVTRADDPDSARAARVAAFAKALFGGYSALLKRRGTPEWSLAQFAAQVAGLPREAEAASLAADAAKDAGAGFAAFETASREADAANPDDRKRAFAAFMQWSRDIGR